VSAVPAAALLGACAVAALLSDRTLSVAVIAVALLGVCLRAPRRRRWPYLAGTLLSGLVLFLLSPLLGAYGGVVYWEGPSVPVLGRLDVTSNELDEALFQGLRLASVGLAFAAYALLLDHDRLLQAGGRLRRSVLAIALATRLVPTLERDVAGYVEALRGRGVVVEGLRGRARLLSPLLAGSLERSLNLAESMEARGFGRPGRTRAPRSAWRPVDRLALTGAVLLVVGSVLWL
jgi:energy-coupling factor transport system permease protein